MGKTFKFPPFGAYLRRMGAVPVSPEDKQLGCPPRMIMGFIHEGYSVYIAPRDTERRTVLQPLEGGVGILSLKTGAPVVPVWAGGTFRAMAPHMKYPRPRKLYVVYGDPIFLHRSRRS